VGTGSGIAGDPFLLKSWIEIVATKGCRWLGNGRLQRAQVSETVSAPRLVLDRLMEPEYLSKREKTHQLAEAPVQLPVLLEHPFCDGLEVLSSRELVCYDCSDEVFRGNAETFRERAKFFELVRGQID